MAALSTSWTLNPQEVCAQMTEKCWTNIDKCNSKSWHFFHDNLFPSPTHPRLPLCKLTCSTQKMKKSAASIPHNLAHAPQPPHGHTHTRTQEIQFTKKDKCNRCHQINTFQQPSFTIRQHFVPAIYRHTHDPCSPTHPHSPHSQWKSLLGSYQDFSHLR